MKITKYLLIISLFILSLFAVACKEPDPEDQWKNKIADYIEEVTECTEKSYEYDEFELSMIRIKVYYTDGTSREIPLTADMLDEADLSKLTKVGQPRIEVWYQACEPIKFVVKLVDSALLDQDLNKHGEYGAVIKAIRKDKTIEFILEANSNACAFQFKYTFDNAIMQVNKATNGSASGTYSIDIASDSITALIVLDEALNQETVLFTVEFEGDFRTSKLGIDNTYANACFALTENYQTCEIEKVLYHASIK